MEACLKAALPFSFYNVSSIGPFTDLEISQEAFLEAYGAYVQALQQGNIINKYDRRIFSSVMTADPEALFAHEVQSGRWIGKLARPIVQVQQGHFFASKIDHQIHPMVMGPESVHWGVQFSFPQIFFDGARGVLEKTSDETLFPNGALFSKLVKWLRAHSVPTTFIWEGRKIATAMRLGKRCFSWIAAHPQLRAQGISVHVY